MAGPLMWIVTQDNSRYMYRMHYICTCTGKISGTWYTCIYMYIPQTLVRSHPQ